MKHKTINGWTKELMKAQIRSNMKAKSIGRNEICAYRSFYDGEPNACAIGCFIPDEHYTPALEGEVPSILDMEFHRDFERLTKKVRLPLNSRALRFMQIVHDESLKDNPAEEVCAWIDANVEDGE